MVITLRDGDRFHGDNVVACLQGVRRASRFDVGETFVEWIAATCDAVELQTGTAPAAHTVNDLFVALVNSGLIVRVDSERHR